MTTRELLDIIRRNVVQPVVLAIYALASILLWLGEVRDALFMSGVITFNTLFGIVQEIRAKMALHKLELMNQPIARVQQPDGTFEEIPYGSLTVGMTLALLPGDEVPADGDIVDSRGLEVNESMLTGESLPIPKPVGESVLSSTSVTAGSASMKVTAVGENTVAGKMTSKLKAYKPELTPLQTLINRVIFYLTFVAVALIALIGMVYWTDGYKARTIFKTITSAGITVIPEGLLLASTVLLAFGSLKLATERVLPQKLSAIEGMALLDVLCTDKTGTLTSETITMDSIEPLGQTNDVELRHLVGTAAAVIGDDNATSSAIVHGAGTWRDAVNVETLAFSSRRKLSGARFDVDGRRHAIIFGAPEFVSAYAPMDDATRERAAHLAANGLRVLLIARMPAVAELATMTEGSGTPIGLVILRNDLRDGVVDTVAFLQERGVSLRVISGDNPDTVKFIAAKAGINNSDQVVTGAELAQLDDKEWEAKALSSTIFARVLPEQKERLIQVFQKSGKYIGMVGDGVNDALALKQSNLGVAMYDGAVATRRVADLVLLNNSFNSLPIGMRLGNRIMQAIEIVTVLSFHKIFYGVFILLATMLIGLQYPFLPRHNTFMNIFAMTLPTIMWTLFPPQPRHRVDPRHFWKDTFWPVIPIGIVSGFAVFVCQYIASAVYALPEEQTGTIMVVVTTLLAMSIALQSGRMMGVVQNKVTFRAFGLYLAAAAVVSSVAFGIPMIRNFFDFTLPAELNPMMVAIVAGVVALALLAQWLLVGLARHDIQRRAVEISVHYSSDRPFTKSFSARSP